MFFFFHLLIGLLIGLLVSDLLHDRRWVIPCVIGSGLPDLIDKPLGYLVFGDTIGYGRIWSHSLLFMDIVIILGIVAWRYRSTLWGLGAGLGILSHQLLDFMWLEPVSWFYPALGPFTETSKPGHFFVL